MATEKPFTPPSAWHAEQYPTHWSFAYEGVSDREDYDFRVEFSETVTEDEERAVIGLVEAAPKLLEALRALVEATSGYARHFHEHLTAVAVIAEATGRAS